MVTAPAKTGLPLMFIDVLGVSAFLGCLLGGGYLTIVRGSEVSGEIRELTAAIREADDDLSTARAA